jgi:hypothetical protein
VFCFICDGWQNQAKCRVLREAGKSTTETLELACEAFWRTFLKPDSDFLMAFKF